MCHSRGDGKRRLAWSNTCGGLISDGVGAVNICHESGVFQWYWLLSDVKTPHRPPRKLLSCLEVQFPMQSIPWLVSHSSRRPNQTKVFLTVFLHKQQGDA